MANKPAYIRNLENRIEQIERNQIDYKEDQDKILIRTGEIHTALMGTEYDRANPGNGTGGGFTKRLTVVEQCTDSLEKWKIRVNARDKLVGGFVVLAIGTLITSALKGWIKFFGP